MTFISRRDLLKRTVAGALVPVARPFQGRDAGVPERSAVQQGLPSAAEHLTVSELQILDAVAARLIPSDEHGPGAREAMAARYIDRALGGALAASHKEYTAGLAALDRYSRSSRGAPFAELRAADQDAVLVDVESGAATGFTGGSAQFFAMVLNHVRQGTFSDPYYGGNANFVGWDLIGYPGVRTMVSAEDQKQLESNELKTNHRSAYDYETFTKATGA